MKESTTYTAEDFANAGFARHPDGRIAARLDERYTRPWSIGEDDWLTDVAMALNGWVPVREAADQPITLDALHEAWENAEQADERHKGDILIRRYPDDPGEVVEVWKSILAGPMVDHARILRRAPKPTRPEGAETLEALLDEWGDLTRGEEPTPLADWLAERGVRVSEHLSEPSDPSVTMSEGEK